MEKNGNNVFYTTFNKLYNVLSRCLNHRITVDTLQQYASTASVTARKGLL